MNNTVAAVESFRFLETTISQEVGHSDWLYCEKGSAEVILPSSTEKVQPATGVYDSFSLLLLSQFCAPL